MTALIKTIEKGYAELEILLISNGASNKPPEQEDISLKTKSELTESAITSSTEDIVFV